MQVYETSTPPIGEVAKYTSYQYKILVNKAVPFYTHVVCREKQNKNKLNR